MENDYAEQSDLDVARHINLALLMCNGISEQDAGFDKIIGLNDDGLAAIARIIGKVRQAAMWQSIETAPKDGTDILVCAWTDTMIVVFFDDEAKDPNYPWGTLDGPNYHKDAPTHWMQLPDPPRLSGQ